MPSHEGEKVPQMPKVIDMESTGLRISARLANKTRQKMVYLLNYHWQSLENVRSIITPTSF